MREQPVAQRIRNFNEVPLGYNETEALMEASRCMQCPKKPCVEGCPVHIDIPAFIRALREKDFQKGIDILHANDSLPCITGRVCPQEEQCQAVCVMKRWGIPYPSAGLSVFLLTGICTTGIKEFMRGLLLLRKRIKKSPLLVPALPGLVAQQSLQKRVFGHCV